jgi:hypothetical protein
MMEHQFIFTFMSPLISYDCGEILLLLISKKTFMCDFTYLECYIQCIYLFEFCLLIAYFLSSNIEIFDIIIVEISLKSIHVEFSLEHVFKVVQCSHIETDLVLAYPFVKFSLNHLILNGGDNDRSSNIIFLW